MGQHEINEHYLTHGDGVKVVAFLVEDSKKSYEETIRRGAQSFLEPTKIEDKNGCIIKSRLF